MLQWIVTTTEVILMFCVIQKVQRKKPNTEGHAKELLVEEDVFTIEGKEITEYSHWFSEERFERPILDAYKISIHHSYRENGKVKKKQWPICTMSYYDIAAGLPFEDFIVISTLEAKVNEMGITRGKLARMIYDKLNPLEDTLRDEYEQTEEYKTYLKHQVTLIEYREAKKEFDELYGKGMYSQIYDVFGMLRNKELLDHLIKTKGTAEEIRKAQEEARKANEEYQKRSKEESRKWYEREYSGYSSGSYSSGSQGNYTDDEKAILKEIYRMASKKFHPDVTKDDGSKMKFITKLKEQWGL